MCLLRPDTTGVLAGKTLITISAGGNSLDTSTCALDSNGAAYCWGANGNGQLGDNSTISSSFPVPVDTSGALAGKTLTMIDAGGRHACALDSDGKAYCWGWHWSGELGIGWVGVVQSPAPVAVVANGVLNGKTLISITAGDGLTCALDATGTPYCWGMGYLGGLGIGPTSENVATPVQIYTGGYLFATVITEISALGSHTCVVDADGYTHCWGANLSGQVGDGEVPPNGPRNWSIPDSPLGNTWTATVSAGTSHTCAMADGGDVFCWGRNAEGQLGDGTTSGRLTPVQVIGFP